MKKNPAVVGENKGKGKKGNKVNLLNALIAQRRQQQIRDVCALPSGSLYKINFHNSLTFTYISYNFPFYFLLIVLSCSLLAVFTKPKPFDFSITIQTCAFILLAAIKTTRQKKNKTGRNQNYILKKIKMI